MGHKRKTSRRKYAREYARKNKDRIRLLRLQKPTTLKSRYSYFSRVAKRRKIENNLSFEDFTNLFELPCFYCGDLSKSKTSGNIDRLDCSLAYSRTNAVSCCTSCNKIKNDELTWQEMIRVAKLLKELRS